MKRTMVRDMYKLHNGDRTTKSKLMGYMLSALCMILPFNMAHSNVLADADGKDDSEVIVAHIKESLASSGLVSVEQHTGRLLFNPNVDKLHSMALKQKFLLPAMVVNQQAGLKLVGELPFSCFMVSANELASDNYKGYRQHDTLDYIRNVKQFPVSRALICETTGSISKQWRKHLDLNEDADPFVFEEHVSIAGERFYYFLNSNGSFEMYY